MANFIEKLMTNPSSRAIEELLQFVEFGKLPLHPDGDFLAYKKVDGNYKDIYTGKMDNSIGTVVQVPRSAVDDDPKQTCSYGLHVCSYEYLRHYGSDDLGGSVRIVLCKINPRDVVAVPEDYNNTKMRVCRYDVVDELKLHEDMLRDTHIYGDYEDEDEGEYEDEGEDE